MNVICISEKRNALNVIRIQYKVFLTFYDFFAECRGTLRICHGGHGEKKDEDPLI